MPKRGGLANRYQHSYETRDSGGGNPAFDWRKAPGEVKFFKAKEGKNRVNIIPYEIKSKNHPLVKSGTAEIGELDYKMDVFIHKSVGPAQADIICLKRNFGKPCPVCEAAEEFKNKGKQKEYEALRPSRRCLYNVVDLRNPESGVQVFEVSHFLFEKELIEEARSCTDDGKIVDFADSDKGKAVIFRASETSLNGQKYFEYKSFQFIDREDAVEDSELEAAVSFDEVMKVLSYEQIQKILYGKDDDDEDAPIGRDLRDEEDSPKDKKGGKSKDPDDEDDPPKKDKDKGGKSKDPDDEDDPPKDKKGGKSKDPEDEDDPPKKDKDKGGKSKDPDDDDPPKKDKDKGESTAAGKCPHGHKFGKDCDEYDECNKCKSWEACCKA